MSLRWRQAEILLEHGLDHAIEMVTGGGLRRVEGGDSPSHSPGLENMYCDTASLFAWPPGSSPRCPKTHRNDVVGVAHYRHKVGCPRPCASAPSSLARNLVQLMSSSMRSGCLGWALSRFSARPLAGFSRIRPPPRSPPTWAPSVWAPRAGARGLTALCTETLAGFGVVRAGCAIATLAIHLARRGAHNRSRHAGPEADNAQAEPGRDPTRDPAKGFSGRKPRQCPGLRPENETRPTTAAVKAPGPAFDAYRRLLIPRARGRARVVEAGDAAASSNLACGQCATDLVLPV